MRTWIFQGNPEVFDIEGYFAASSGLITWSVAKYADQMSPGDTVYIWQSQGQDAARAGILAGDNHRISQSPHAFSVCRMSNCGYFRDKSGETS